MKAEGGEEHGLRSMRETELLPRLVADPEKEKTPVRRVLHRGRRSRVVLFFTGVDACTRRSADLDRDRRLLLLGRQMRDGSV